MGLAQCEIEAAGIPTISLSAIPELTSGTGAPRVAGIERPFGQTVGSPGDAAGQMAVLRATLNALAGIRMPGQVVHLPFPEAPGKRRGSPPEAPPIGKYLMRHPWELPRLLRRDIPEN